MHRTSKPLKMYIPENIATLLCLFVLICNTMFTLAVLPCQHGTARHGTGVNFANVNACRAVFIAMIIIINSVLTPRSAGTQVLVRTCWYASIGTQVLVRKCWYASPGMQVLVRKCWYASAGTQVLVRKCWYASAGTQVLVRTCWYASIGTQVLVRKCWYASPGMQVLVRKCWYASAGTQVLVRTCWYASAGMQVLVCKYWYASPGTQVLVRKCWYARAGMQVLVRTCWYASAGTQVLVRKYLQTGPVLAYVPVLVHKYCYCSDVFSLCGMNFHSCRFLVLSIPVLSFSVAIQCTFNLICVGKLLRDVYIPVYSYVCI